MVRKRRKNVKPKIKTFKPKLYISVKTGRPVKSDSKVDKLPAVMYVISTKTGKFLKHNTRSKYAKRIYKPLQAYKASETRYPKVGKSVHYAYAIYPTQKSVAEAYKLIKASHRAKRTMVQILAESNHPDISGASNVYLFSQTDSEFLFRILERMKKSIKAKSYDENGNEIFESTAVKYYINIITKDKRK